MTSLDIQVPPLEFVELSGYRMAYRQWGDTDRSDALVLVHGITSSSLSWVRVAPRLAQSARVIAVDLKGHGDSGRPASGYRLTDQANEVAGLVRELGLSSVQLLGHSWGGGISLELGARAGLPLARLVLEDPAVWTSGGSPEQRAQVVNNYIASVGLSPEAAETRVRANVAPGWTEEDVLGKIDATVKTSPTSVHAVFTENGAWDLVDRLTLLRVPTLLVRAETANGGIVPKHVVAIAASNPAIRVVTIPGADHNIHRGQFDAFMTAVEPFLGS